MLGQAPEFADAQSTRCLATDHSAGTHLRPWRAPPSRGCAPCRSGPSRLCRRGPESAAVRGARRSARPSSCPSGGPGWWYIAPAPGYGDGRQVMGRRKENTEHYFGNRLRQLKIPGTFTSLLNACCIYFGSFNFREQLMI